MRKSNKNLPIVILENDNIKDWTGGSYCITFVYSNKGNFIVKGYFRETRKYLNELKERNYKFFYNIMICSIIQKWNWWGFYLKDYTIVQNKAPKKNNYRTISNLRDIRRWKIYSGNELVISLKRSPTSWLNFFNNLT